MKRNCIIGQSGGPTIAINASLAGIIHRAKASQEFENVYGMINGIKGLLEGRYMDLLEEFDVKTIIYVNTPGSFMSIKIAYIFLKTITMIKDIEFLAANGFLFNQNSPIKALGKKYFINENEEIKVDFLPNMCKISDFELPKSLENIDFSKDTLPIYNLPAV